MHDPDTICVVSSALGEAGIGVIRMSGPQAHSVLRSIFRSKKSADSFISHRLYLGFIVNPETDEPVDEVFAVFMHKPSTYTREEMAEVYSHGGIAPQRQILSLMVQSGARVAEPGEFTKRAFLNGRIDLAQAESVLDIIRSESDEEAKSALQHLTGRFSEKVGLLREELKHALANTEALIDFPEEELDIDKKQTVTLLQKAEQSTRELIDSYANGRALKNGLEVLIVGRTNVGKSSLLNALLMEEKAIVTPLPGTTRDLVEDVLHVNGVKLRIIDTAGLRKPRDVAEKEGIDRVKKRIPGADVILWVLDNAEDYRDEDEQIFQSIQQKTIVIAVNKTDLPQKLARHKIPAKGRPIDFRGHARGNLFSEHGEPGTRVRVREAPTAGYPLAGGVEGATGYPRAGVPVIDVCALTGVGLEELKQAIYEAVMGKGHKSPAILITNVRHRDTLIKADEAIERAIACSNNGEPLELTAFELREALSRLGEITGETCTDEILDDIFSRFCIGK
jgi:tRNA modification GTPase